MDHWPKGVLNVAHRHPKGLREAYLESKDMVQIFFDFGEVEVEGLPTGLIIEMGFNRYEGKIRDRCVFAATPGPIWPH